MATFKMSSVSCQETQTNSRNNAALDGPWPALKDEGCQGGVGGCRMCYAGVGIGWGRRRSCDAPAASISSVRDKKALIIVYQTGNMSGLLVRRADRSVREIEAQVTVRRQESC